MVLIAFFLFAAHTTITFRPFSIKFERLPYALGCMMIFIGISLVYYGGHKEGQKVSEDAIYNTIKARLEKDKQIDL